MACTHRIPSKGRLAWPLLLLLSSHGCHSHDHPHEADAHANVEHEHAEHGDDQEAGHDEGEGEHGHGHGHGEGAIGITKFTSKLELFAEHPPAVTGEELPFLAHLTILDGFEALEDATVILVLDGPQRVQAKVDEMLRPGIFQPTLTAPDPGTYRGSLVVKGPKVEDTIEGFEMVVHPSAEAAQAAAQTEPSPSAEPISFLKEQQWKVPFGTAFAEQGTLVPTIEVAGEITTPPSGQAEVGAPIAGRVVAPKAGLPKPGQAVKAGELIATIAPAPATPEAGARAELAVVEAEARLEAAKAEVERAARLIADRAIPQRQVDEARRELRVAQEALQAAHRAKKVFTGAARGRGPGTYRLTAPIDGIVTEVRATEGKSVTSGELLARIVNMDELWIRARVPEQQAARLQADQDAAFMLSGLDAWIPLDVTGEDASAWVVNIGRTVDLRSRTVDVIYGLRHPEERMRVGAMVRVAVPSGEAWQGVIVPHTAIIEDEGRSLVHVQLEGEAFEERTVELGPRSGSLVGIARGVDADERVVTRGANFIRLASRSSSAPAHGHVH